MADWRGTTSAATQAEIDVLVNGAMDRAVGDLAAKTWFAPFAIVLGHDGTHAIVTPPGGLTGDLVADTTGVFDRLLAGRTQLRAFALVAPTAAGDGAAIGITVEHVDGFGIGVLMPYAVDPRTGRTDLGVMRTDDIRPVILVS